MPAVGVVSQFAKVGTCSPTGVQLCRLSFRPLQGSSKADSGEVANPKSENKDANEQRALFGPRVHVSHRFVDSHRETGGFGSPSHETDSVALDESLARARGPRERDSSSQISISSSAVVAGVLSGQPLHPLQHALQLFTDASNEGWGAHLGDHTTKGVWSDSESQLHINFLELKAVLLALKKFEQQC